MVTVLVGKPQVEFTAHKSVLCERSAFFAAALKPEWTNNQERVVQLPEDDPQAFSAYLEWAYRGSFTLDIDDVDNGIDAITMPLAQLYVLAEKLGPGMMSLKNAAIDKLIACLNKHECVLEEGTVCYVYQNTLETSKIRKWIEDDFAYDTKESLMTTSELKDYPLEMTIKVLHRLKQQYESSQLRRSERPPQKDRYARCYYHEHGEDSPPCE